MTQNTAQNNDCDVSESSLNLAQPLAPELEDALIKL